MKVTLTCRLSPRMLAILAATDNRQTCLEKFFHNILSAFINVEKVEINEDPTSL